MNVRNTGAALAMVAGKAKRAAVAAGSALTLAAGSAMAQGGTGFGAAVTDTIDDTRGDVVTIGIAVLAVIVLIAAIAWVSRAINK